MTSLLIGLMVLAHIADLISTHLALARGCVELNPLFHLWGWPGLLGAKVVSLSVLVWMSYFLGSQGRDRDALTILWVGIAAGFGAAVWNLYQLPRC